MKFRLLEIAHFRMSERTLFDNLRTAHPRLHLAKDDVVAFLSKTEDQLVFVHNYARLDDGALVLQSHRLRLTKGTWNITKLREFSREAGLFITDWSVLEKAFDRAAAKITTAVRRALAA